MIRSMHAFYNIFVVSIGCPSHLCTLHCRIRHLETMGKSHFKFLNWILELEWDLSFTL